MKKYLIVGSALAVSLLASACANSESTAQQAAAAAANCGAPVVDGTVKSLDSSCRVSSDEEHLRLEGVSVSSGRTLTIWTSSDASQASAYKIEFNGTNGRITITNLAQGAASTIYEAFTLSASETYCFDLHGDEDPAHVMMWKGSTNCNATPGNNLAAVEFESEDCGATGCTIANWNAGDTKPAGSGVYYQASATGVTVSKISTNTPRNTSG
ncbi:MAG: hypothetical protein ACOY5B_16010 [Spirochaetota bacterium]